MSEQVELEVLRRLARDQWVRLHGTPRVTVLVGDGGRQIWDAWLGVWGGSGTLFEEDDIDRSVRSAVQHALERPEQPVGLIARRETLGQWRVGRDDRLAAMIDEGLLDIPALPRITDREALNREASVSAETISMNHVKASPIAPVLDGRIVFDARSVAEAVLFEALEATPATKGRFALNENLSVCFGPRAAEVDLLSRGDRIAIEIDGIHHFADADCYRRDRRKDLLLQTQGLLVIRLLAEDVVRDPRDAVSVVCKGLAFRAGESR